MFLQSELEFEPRYPLFGGWKATFVIGYGLPLEDFLFESPDGRRYLNFTFGCPLVETVVNKLTIKVSLVTCVCIHIVAVLIFPHIASRLMFEIWMICLLPVTFQVALPEGSKDPSAVIPFPVEQHLEVTKLVNSHVCTLVQKFSTVCQPMLIKIYLHI